MTEVYEIAIGGAAAEWCEGERLCIVYAELRRAWRQRCADVGGDGVVLLVLVLLL